MTTSIKRTVQIAALTAAFTASGSAMALAGTGAGTSGNSSILGGNQINVPISVPVSVCGNALALLGDAFDACQGGASTSGSGHHQHHHHSGSHGATTSGNHSVGGGNQINVPITVPVSICGNSVAGLGHAASGCKGGASTGTTGGSMSGGRTSGSSSILGGNQITIPIGIPVSVCGISVGVLGDATSSCQGQVHAHMPPPGHHHKTPPPHYHKAPPPAHHHHKTPPPSRHHHTTVTAHQAPPAPSVTVSSTLPTTGANFLGLLALAGGVAVSGAGCMLLAAKRGLLRGAFALTRRAASTVMAR
jgi:hypothetical protein